MDYKSEAQPKAWADGVPVHCAHDAIVDVTTLVPNPKNPNTHPDTQIQLLGRIIRQTGWRQPITVSKRSGFIVKGHGRLAAALLEGVKEVPVDYQNYANEAEEYADLVADNRIAELAEIDNKLLADIFADIDTGEIPMEMTGFTEAEVEKLITAMSEALHDEEKDADDTEESMDTETIITREGDLWVLGNCRVVCGDPANEKYREVLYDNACPDIVLSNTPLCGVLAITSTSKTLYIMEKEPDFAEAIVRRYIKTTGKTTGIRLLRKGKELGREHFESMFTN